MMKRIARLIIWHRRAGLLFAPILVVLAITGVMINHSFSWGWNEKPVYSSLVGWFYGIPAAQVDRGYVVAEARWLTQHGDLVRLDTSELLRCDNPLAGAINWNEGFVVLCQQQLFWFTAEGELIEALSELPVSRELGLSESGALLIAGQGQLWQFDDNNWEWQRQLADTDARWAELVDIPQTDSVQLSQRLPLPGISRERLLLDLHSGRLFGDLGVFVVDLSAVLLVFLVFSGSLTWGWRRWRKRTRRSN